MGNLLKRENLYLSGGIIYGGGDNGNNNKGGGGYGGGGGGGGICGGGGGNSPRKRLRKKSRKILPTERRETLFKALNAKRNVCGGNKHTYQYLARLKKATKYKIKGGLPTT